MTLRSHASVLLLTALGGANLARAASAPAPGPIAGCEQIVTPEVFAELQQQATDPAVSFEQWRRSHRISIMASRRIDCLHRAWQVAQGSAAPAAPAASLEMPPSVPSSTTVGANLPAAGGVTDYQGETAIAVNPNNAQQLVAGANTFFQDPTAACQSPTGGAASTFGTQALYGSGNGGSSWTYNCAPWPSTLTGGVPSAAAWFGSDPAMAWDNAGNAYAAYLLISQDGTGAFLGSALVVAKSTDGGLTWPRANTGIVVNHLSSTTIFDDKEMLAVDTSVGGAHSHTNRIYVVWDENNVEKVAHADNLTTWTTVTIGNGATLDIGGDIKVGADGTVYAVWNDVTNCPPNGGDVTLFRSSTDGGTTWSAQKTVFTHGLASFCQTSPNNLPPAQDVRGVNAFPSLGVDNDASSPNFNRLYVATCDFPSGVTSGTNLNIYTVFSTDGGSTWPSSSKVKVNDDTGTVATQFFPWMAVDQVDGSVSVSWYDTRNFTTLNRKTQVFYAHSSTGAASFDANVLVTDGGPNFTNHVNYSDENSADNAASNPNQYGDYSGMAAFGLLAHPFWTDTREYFPTGGDARLEDAATALLTNSCSPPPAPSAGNNGPICAGQTLQLTASTVSGATYSWTGPNAFASTLQNPSIPNATTAASGTYSVVATVGTCASSSGTTNATVNAVPAAPTAGNNGPICVGQTLQLTASTISGATYSWTGPNGFASTQQNPSIPNATTAASGTYSVTAAVLGCASAAGTTNAVVSAPPPAPTAGNNGPVCAGQTLQLTASTISGATYGWTGPNGFASSLQNPSIPSVTTAATGSYSVLATVGTCVSAAGTTNATVNALPSAVITASSGVCTSSTGNVASVPSAGVGASYSWSVSNGSLTGGAGTPSITFTAGTSGSVGLVVVVQNAQGCSANGSQNVPISPPPSTPVAQNNGPICTGQTLQLTASTVAGATYSWTGPNGFTSTLQNPSIAGATTADSGTYSVVAIVGGCASAAGTTAATVTAGLATPVITAPRCAAIGAVGLSASVAATATTYQWSITGGTITSDPTQPQVTFDAGPAGTLMTLSVVETLTGQTCPSDPGTWNVQVDFLDVPPSNPFHDFVCTIARDAVTAGCGGGNFCPTSSVLRSQMAVFLLRGEHGPLFVPPPAVGIFSDVPASNPFAPWIEQIYSEGITGGCSTNPLDYCPSSSVTRASMAVFLLVAQHGTGYLPPACTGLFADVPCPGPFTDWIEQLYTEGITGGCGTNPPVYCPSDAVTRDQMAVFLTTTFNLP